MKRHTRPDKNKQKHIDEIAAAFFFLEDYAGRFDPSESNYIPEYENLEDAREMFFRQVNSLDSPPWERGKHYGDCTNVPMTCNRCLVDDYRTRAKIWLLPLSE